MSSLHEFSSPTNSLLNNCDEKLSQSLNNSVESNKDVVSLSLMNELVTAVNAELQHIKPIVASTETSKTSANRKNSIGDLNTLYSKVKTAITQNRDSSHSNHTVSDVKAKLVEIANPIENSLILSFDTSVIADINDEIDNYGQIVKSEDKNLINLVESNKRFRSYSLGKPPMYKYLDGTNYVVDAFQWGHIPNITGYFLR